MIPADDLTETFLTMSLVTSTVLKMIGYFIEDEFVQFASLQTPADENLDTLLRDNSLASKLIKAYFRALGGSYLQEILGDIMTQIAMTERKYSLEINPR
jgi:hypothetical protein